MIDMLTLKPGDRLLLREKVVAEVVENMEDGMWVQVRYLQVPGDESQVGSVEFCHAQDVLRMADT